MSPRPYIRSTIVDLEDLFAAKRTDTGTLNALKTELQFRNVPRATSLLAKVNAVLSGERALTATAQTELFGLTPPSLLLAPRPTDVILPKPAAKAAEKVAEVPAMEIDKAYKLLGVTAGRPWEEVEHARAKLVQKSHPDALEGSSAEQRAAALLNAKRANAAYDTLAKDRCR